MPKQQQTDKESIKNDKIIEESVELPESIPPETMLTVEESTEDPELATVTTIPLSPRETINQKAKEAREARKLPTIPGYSPSLEQLQEWFKLLDDDMWTHVTPYLYRKWPVIVRQLSDPENKNYIDMICKEHVDEGLIEYITSKHGGGSYKFIINDLDLKTPRGNSKSIMEPSFKINDNEHPPILDLKEIDVNERKNMGFINQMVSKGLMDTRGNIMQSTQGTGTNGAEMAGAIGGVYDKFMTTFAAMNKDQQSLITKLLGDNTGKKSDPEGIGALLLEKLKQDDPNKQTQTMLAMMTTIMGMMPKQEKQDDGILKLLIAQMQESTKNQLDFMKLMMTQQQTPAKEEKSDDFIDKLIKYRTVMPELFGNGGREPKKELGELVLEGAREFLLPTIGLVSQFMQTNKGVAPIVPVTEGQAKELVAQHQQKVISMPPPSQQPSPGQPKAEPPAKDPNGNPILDPNNLTVCQRLLMQYGGMLITAIKAGTNGAELADSLESAKPLIGDVYGMLAAQGAEKILEAMESIPEFWNQTGVVYGKEHMEQLITDFLMDPPDDDGEGNEDEENRLPIRKEPVQ